MNMHTRIVPKLRRIRTLICFLFKDADAPENITEEMKKANAALEAVKSEINKIETKKAELKEKYGT